MRHSSPMTRAPMAMALASLCWRASAAESGSDTSAQRQGGLRLAAIEMPMPDPHNATPRSAWHRPAPRRSRGRNRDSRRSPNRRSPDPAPHALFAKPVRQHGLQRDGGMIGCDRAMRMGRALLTKGMECVRLYARARAMATPSRTESVPVFRGFARHEAHPDPRRPLCPDRLLARDAGGGEECRRRDEHARGSRHGGTAGDGATFTGLPKKKGRDYVGRYVGVDEACS